MRDIPARQFRLFTVVIKDYTENCEGLFKTFSDAFDYISKSAKVLKSLKLNQIVLEWFILLFLAKQMVTLNLQRRSFMHIYLLMMRISP